MTQEIMHCKFCGCTDTRACQGGCFWIKPDVCSTCYWKRLPNSLRTQIKILGRCGALSKETGTSHFDSREAKKLSTGTIGALARRELADKRVVVRHKAQRTHYWLTPTGVCLFELYRSTR